MYEEETQIESLKGVMVQDIDNGIKFVVVNSEDKTIKEYNIKTNNADMIKLFSTCERVSRRIYNTYFENGGVLPTQYEVIVMFREESEE